MRIFVQFIREEPDNGKMVGQFSLARGADQFF